MRAGYSAAQLVASDSSRSPRIQPFVLAARLPRVETRGNNGPKSAFADCGRSLVAIPDPPVAACRLA